MENRLGAIPRFSYNGKSFKIFRIDLEKGGTKLTCTEKVALILQMKFVLGSDAGTLLPSRLHCRAIQVLKIGKMFSIILG